MRHLRLLLIVASMLGCSSNPSAEGTAQAAVAVQTEVEPSVEAPVPARARPVARPPTPPSPRVQASAGDRVEIPAGTLRVGSRPGTVGRRPSVEADLSSVDMPVTHIDRLPYPNDPGLPIHRAGTRAEAESLCEAREQRLCTELEWERACRGDGDAEWASGSAMDVSACLEDPASCASPTGVLALGLEAPEWTASEAGEHLARFERTTVVRGAHRGDDASAHRCGARRSHDPAGGGPALAFRCCEGPVPEVTYPDVGLRRPFRDLDFDDARWRQIFAQLEPLARFAEDFHAYDRSDALRALGRGGATLEEMTWDLAPGAFAWSPSVGEEVWLVAGRSGDSTVLAAIYPTPDGPIHAASFVLDDETAPVALLRSRGTRREVIWSTCWSCMGESGVFRFDDDASLVIVQR